MRRNAGADRETELRSKIRQLEIAQRAQQKELLARADEESARATDAEAARAELGEALARCTKLQGENAEVALRVQKLTKLLADTQAQLEGCKAALREAEAQVAVARKGAGDERTVVVAGVIDQFLAFAIELESLETDPALAADGPDGAKWDSELEDKLKAVTAHRSATAPLRLWRTAWHGNGSGRLSSFKPNR